MRKLALITATCLSLSCATAASAQQAPNQQVVTPSQLALQLNSGIAALAARAEAVDGLEKQIVELKGQLNQAQAELKKLKEPPADKPVAK